jgi:DNA-directed RNA polymerase specialized sigma24 family protein
VNLDPQPVNPGLQSVNLDPQSVTPPRRLEDFSGMPSGLAEKLKNLKQKAPLPQLEEIVWQLCHWQALSAEDLAALLGRNRNYVTNRLVTPMLRSRRLEMTIPNQPNHPLQQYRALDQPGN